MGTAGAQLTTQRQKGGAVIGEAEHQVSMGIAAQKQMQQVNWNTALLNMSNQTLGIHQEAQTEQANIWISTLTSFFNFGSQTIGSNFGSVLSPIPELPASGTFGGSSGEGTFPWDIPSDSYGGVDPGEWY